MIISKNHAAKIIKYGRRSVEPENCDHECPSENKMGISSASIFNLITVFVCIFLAGCVARGTTRNNRPLPTSRVISVQHVGSNNPHMDWEWLTIPEFKCENISFVESIKQLNNTISNVWHAAGPAPTVALATSFTQIVKGEYDPALEPMFDKMLQELGVDAGTHALLMQETQVANLSEFLTHTTVVEVLKCLSSRSGLHPFWIRRANGISLCFGPEAMTCEAYTLSRKQSLRLSELERDGNLTKAFSLNRGFLNIKLVKDRRLLLVVADPEVAGYFPLIIENL